MSFPRPVRFTIQTTDRRWPARTRTGLWYLLSSFSELFVPARVLISRNARVAGKLDKCRTLKILFEEISRKNRRKDVFLKIPDQSCSRHSHSGLRAAGAGRGCGQGARPSRSPGTTCASWCPWFRPSGSRASPPGCRGRTSSWSERRSWIKIIFFLRKRVSLQNWYLKFSLDVVIRIS